MPQPSSPTFSVREIPVYGDVILSPMDGFSDYPFRSLCRELGSAMSYTEFVNVRDIHTRPGFADKKFYFDGSERPLVFQIYGDDPDEILSAALQIRDRNPDILDINLGCPAKSVAHRGAGVGMMRTPLKIARTFKKLTTALDIPITGKIRMGWEDCKNYKLVARIIEENGGSLVAVHARTKEQGYHGQADWDVIAEVRQTVGIPVIGNGDVVTVADIARMKEYTRCDAVMIGRAAMGNPWIFSKLDREQVRSSQVRAMMREHLKRNIEFYGERAGLLLFRKHAVRYMSPYRLPVEQRKELLSCERMDDFLRILDTHLLT